MIEDILENNVVAKVFVEPEPAIDLKVDTGDFLSD